MTFVDSLKSELDDRKSVTEKGAIGYSTSSSKLLDMNFKLTSYRSLPVFEILGDFNKAYAENPSLAIKWLFYARDIRGGLGERRLFRVILSNLACNKPDNTKNIIPLIASFGRWDDLLVLIDTPCEDTVLSIIKYQLQDDLKCMEENKPISLLAKWLPSENASSTDTIELAKIVRRYLGLSSKEYRKTLSKLRKYLNVVEVDMSSNNWGNINYSTVPSRANLIYSDAFYRNDTKRRIEYLESLKKGETKINAGVLYPHDIAFKYRRNNYRMDETLEELWKGLPNILENTNSRSIVCMDGSGSMQTRVGGGNATALDVSQSLAIYYSEHLTGEFKDKFISFGSNPELVDLSNCVSLADKLSLTQAYSDWGTTNLKSVFDTILSTAINNNLPQEELPDNIIIISDMEFDTAFYSKSVRALKSLGNTGFEEDIFKVLLELIQEEYEKAGYKLPKLIFWNVCSRTNIIPLKQNENGIILISGFSVNTIKMILTNELDPYKALVKTLDTPWYNLVAEAWNKQ